MSDTTSVKNTIQHVLDWQYAKAAVPEFAYTLEEGAERKRLVESAYNLKLQARDSALACARAGLLGTIPCDNSEYSLVLSWKIKSCKFDGYVCLEPMVTQIIDLQPQLDETYE